MRTIHFVPLTAVAILFLATGTVRGQGPQPVMVGMPEYGVALIGTPEDPVIENHSGRVIIGYNIETADANGRVMGGVGQILAPSLLPAGLPDGKSLYAMDNFPVDPNLQRGNRAVNTGARPAARATLTSVIFADGHFVGADERGVFERLGQQIKVVRELGILAKAGAWNQLDALALSAGSRPGPPPSGEDPRTYFERRSIATHLVQEWKFKGDAAAAQLADIYSSLPTPWK